MWLVTYTDCTIDADSGCCTAAILGQGTTRIAAMQDAAHTHNSMVADNGMTRAENDEQELTFAEVASAMQESGYMVALVQVA